MRARKSQKSAEKENKEMRLHFEKETRYKMSLYISQNTIRNTMKNEIKHKRHFKKKMILLNFVTHKQHNYSQLSQTITRITRYVLQHQQYHYWKTRTYITPFRERNHYFILLTTTHTRQNKLLEQYMT